MKPQDLYSGLQSKIALQYLKRIFGRSLLVACLSLVIIVGGAFAYRERYTGKVFPGVAVAHTELGGLTGQEVKQFIEQINNRFAKEGLPLSVVDSTGKPHAVMLSPVLAGENPVVLIELDSDSIAGDALLAGRSPNFLTSLWLPLAQRFGLSGPVAARTRVDQAALRETLQSLFAPWEKVPLNARFAMRGTEFTVIPEEIGSTYDYPAVTRQLTLQVASLSFAPQTVEPVTAEPAVKQAEAETLLTRLPGIFAFGSLSVQYVNAETKAPEERVLTVDDLKKLAEVRKDENGAVMVALAEKPTVAFLEKNIKPLVEKEAKEAKFKIEGNKVEEFQTSQTGLTLDAAKTYADLDAAFRSRNYDPVDPIKTVSISFALVEPKIKTADLNNLGITEIIGIGNSTFKDSHTNRIKNIAHAVERLNGILIKPGEEFSTNKYAGPYTLENGYLPEQVIKGNEIKPEVGGGMCQIGTTMFRAAMNSAMPITERKNHSLVVSYYADPVNHNPGTDATLYEPILDFKFLNDTGNYLLLQTDIDYKKQLLTFTLWGKADGRQGSYTHPLVSKWIASGEPQVVYTDDEQKVAPGKKKCQAAFRGAVASFTYTRLTPQGEKIDRVFESYYRPLPQMCVVGVAKGELCPDGKPCPAPAAVETATASSTP